MQVAEFASQIEQDFTLVGVTAVEDELQDDVRDTLHCLRNAHIKVWMLTGDKLETAINIGHSSGLLHHDDILITLKSDDEAVSEHDIKNFFAELESKVYIHDFQTSEFKSRFEANRDLKSKFGIEEDLQVHICVAFGGSSFRIINNLYREEVVNR